MRILERHHVGKKNNAFYLNLHDYMLNENGDIREELFTKNGPHMNRKGYALWKDMFSANKKEFFMT